MGRRETAHDRRVRAVVVARIALPLALVALIPSLVGLWLLDGQNDKIAAQASANTANAKALAAQVRENARTLRFICSTTGVLDGLVQGVVEQTDKNFAKGPDGLSTYDRLLARGIVTQENIDAAHAARNAYVAAHAKLTAPTSPCQDVPGAARPDD